MWASTKVGYRKFFLGSSVVVIFFIVIANIRCGPVTPPRATRTPVSLSDDHPDEFPSATRLTLGDTMQGRLDSSRDYDRFSFEGQCGWLYRVEATGSAVISVALFDSENYSFMDGESNGSGSSVLLEFISTTNRTFYAQVYSGFLDGTGPYTIKVAQSFQPNWSAQCGADDGNTIGDATPVEVGEPIETTIHEVGDVDFFSFSAKPGYQYSIEATGLTDPNIPGSTVDPWLRLYDQAGQVIAGDGGGGGNFRATINWSAEREGIYYLSVRWADYSPISSEFRFGGYSLNIAQRPAPADDYGNSASTATRIMLGQIISGSIERAGDVDFFSFEATSGEVYKFDLTSDFIHRLYGPDGSDLSITNTVWTAPSTDTYYVRVESWYSNGFGDYELVLTLAPKPTATPTLRASATPTPIPTSTPTVTPTPTPTPLSIQKVTTDYQGQATVQSASGQIRVKVLDSDTTNPISNILISAVAVDTELIAFLCDDTGMYLPSFVSLNANASSMNPSLAPTDTALTVLLKPIDKLANVLPSFANASRIQHQSDPQKILSEGLRPIIDDEYHLVTPETFHSQGIPLNELASNWNSIVDAAKAIFRGEIGGEVKEIALKIFTFSESEASVLGVAGSVLYVASKAQDIATLFQAREYIKYGYNSDTRVDVYWRSAGNRGISGHFVLIPHTGLPPHKVTGFTGSYVLSQVDGERPSSVQHLVFFGGALKSRFIKWPAGSMPDVTEDFQGILDMTLGNRQTFNLQNLVVEFIVEDVFTRIAENDITVNWKLKEMHNGTDEYNISATIEGTISTFGNRINATSTETINGTLSGPFVVVFERL